SHSCGDRVRDSREVRSWLRSRKQHRRSRRRSNNCLEQIRYEMIHRGHTMPNGSDSALGLTRDAATASDAQPEKPSARAPWQGRYPSNGQAHGVRSNGSGLVPGGVTAQGDTPSLRDRARTGLPVEYQGREVVFEAHAYEDDSASYQALALVYRGTSPSSADELPLVRVHSGCATGDI